VTWAKELWTCERGFFESGEIFNVHHSFSYGLIVGRATSTEQWPPDQVVIRSAMPEARYG
jgi:hypothetical protein